MSSRSRIEEGETREREVSPGDLVRIVKDELLSRGLWRTAWLSEESFAAEDGDKPLCEVDWTIACLVISVVEFDRAGDKGETALVIESESGLVGWIDNARHLEKT